MTPNHRTRNSRLSRISLDAAVAGVARLRAAVQCLPNSGESGYGDWLETRIGVAIRGQSTINLSALLGRENR